MLGTRPAASEARESPTTGRSPADVRTVSTDPATMALGAPSFSLEQHFDAVLAQDAEHGVGYVRVLQGEELAAPVARS